MPNALANETSPYLLQHQENPVDWRPWGEEALRRAKEEQKVIFLSIGYSACHWCHVMEHESFENERIADYLNEHFIAIKVDREERPDLDQVYMNAIQAMTGRGGWPMSVFLTPDLKPFYGGTYWPPTAGRGMPGFDQVLSAVHDAWTNRRDEALENADKLTAQLAALNRFDGDVGELNHGLIDNACRALERSYDPTHGGFGAAPKFLHTMDMALLLRQWKTDGRQAWLDMVSHTLDRMSAGGLYDHLGGGFARYSVDERWLVPHFEKMLYDNALMAGLLAEAHAASGEESFARTARDTLDYVLRDMTDPAGAFYSTEDADSAPEFDDQGNPAGHNEEGLFYTWRPEEIRKAIGEEASDTFCRVYDVTPIGNFEGRNILSLPKSIATQAKLLGHDERELSEELAEGRKKLFKLRQNRPRPGLDDKVITAWNGLMIEAMAYTGALLGEQRYVAAAASAADFVLENIRDDEAQLLHTWRNGHAKLPAYLDDYAAMACGLVALYEATFDERRIDQACALVDTILGKFSDPDTGGFFYTSEDQEQLIFRNKELTDNATPGGNSLAATALMRLAKLTGDTKYHAAAGETLRAGLALMQRAPAAMGQMLCALDLYLGPTKEIILVGEGPETHRIAADLRRRYLPHCVLAGRINASGGEGAPHSGSHHGAAESTGAPASQSAPATRISERLEPVFANKQPIDGQPTLYVCENFACQAPVVGAVAIAAAVEEI